MSDILAVAVITLIAVTIMWVDKVSDKMFETGAAKVKLDLKEGTICGFWEEDGWKCKYFYGATVTREEYYEAD